MVRPASGCCGWDGGVTGYKLEVKTQESAWVLRDGLVSICRHKACNFTFSLYFEPYENGNKKAVPCAMLVGIFYYCL